MSLHFTATSIIVLSHIAITREGAQGKQKSAARLSTTGLQNEVHRICLGSRYL